MCFRKFWIAALNVDMHLPVDMQLLSGLRHGVRRNGVCVISGDGFVLFVWPALSVVWTRRAR